MIVLFPNNNSEKSFVEKCSAAFIDALRKIAGKKGSICEFPYESKL